MKRKREKGAILPFLAISLPVLIAGLGLVIDNGAMYELKRRAQTASDAAALAGAHEIDRANPAGIVNAAIYDAKQNGFQVDAATDSFVTVNNPPKAGRYKGDAAFVEVIVEERAPLFFMSAFMEEGYVVRARSVAGARPDNHCVYTMDPDSRDAFNVSGTADVEFVDCGVAVNSSDAGGARTNGGGKVKAKRFDVVGDYTGDGFDPQPHTAQPPMSDPLQDIEAPEITACDYNKTVIKGVATLHPGVYCDGLKFSANAEATLNPGTYIINGGGLVVSAGAEAVGTEVTFYITAESGHRYDAITINGGGYFEVSAPKSGALKGMLIFEDRNLKNVGEHKFNGGGDMLLEGAIYTPNADVKIAGNFGAAAQKIMLVVNKLDISGNPKFASTDTGALPIEVLIPRIVE